MLKAGLGKFLRCEHQELLSVVGFFVVVVIVVFFFYNISWHILTHIGNSANIKDQNLETRQILYTIFVLKYK